MISVHVNFLLYVDIHSRDMKNHYSVFRDFARTRITSFDYTAITTAIQGLAYKKTDIFFFVSNRIFHRNYGNVVDISGHLL